MVPFLVKSNNNMDEWLLKGLLKELMEMHCVCAYVCRGYAGNESKKSKKTSKIVQICVNLKYGQVQKLSNFCVKLQYLGNEFLYSFYDLHETTGKKIAAPPQGLTAFLHVFI